MTEAPFVERRVPNRYVLNRRHRVAHDRTRLSERCNTDQIIDRRGSAHIPVGYRTCTWCRLEVVRG